MLVWHTPWHPSLYILFVGDNSAILSDSFDCPEFSSWVADLCLSRADEQALLNEKWLSTNHISAANRLMKRKFPSQNGLQDTCVLEQKGIWPSCADDFVQVIHVQPNHWACVSNIFSPAGVVDLYDSLHTHPEEDGAIVSKSCQILHYLEPTITIRVINVGLQKGLNDCGLFAIAMAYDLCNGEDPSLKIYVQDEMRKHLHSCFTNASLNRFPSHDIDITSRVIFNLSVNIYCICRMPELSKWMVCCDRCDEWYHEGCVTIPQEVREDENNEVPWRCHICQNGILLFVSWS